MSTCENCGGLIAEPGKVYGWGGKFCHCLIPRRMEFTIPDELQEKVERLQSQQSWNTQVTPMSILQLCEKMSLEEVKALIGLLTAYYDCAVLSAHPGGFKKRETDE